MKKGNVRETKRGEEMASTYSLLNSSHTQVSTASDSAFLPSEPPDIRNWFSSYEYESPELNSGANFEVCDSLNENDCENYGNDVEEKKQEQEGNLVKPQTIGKTAEFVVDEIVASKGLLKCKNSVGTGNNYSQSQALDSSDSLLLSSEYNIKNWFSSYKYESPVLSTSEEDFGLSDFKETESDRYEHQLVYKGEQVLVLNKNPFVLSDSPLETVSEKIVGGKISANNDGNSSKNDEKTIQQNKNSTENQKRKSLEVIPSSSSPKRNLDARTISKTEHQDAIITNTDSLSKTVTNTDLSADGFISMKKNKSRSMNDENSLKGQVVDRRIKTKAERKVLSEKTNFQHCDVLGVTGKWRCPQKSKPNLGPPLKQLRLEQWVHRV